MLTQKEILNKFLPIIEENGKVYEKTTEIDARLAVFGEIIIDGKEKQSTAGKKDWVIRNKTSAQEQYIISDEEIRKRCYIRSMLVNGWYTFRERGECKAIQYTGEELQFQSPQNEIITLKFADFVAIIFPEKNEIYRFPEEDFSKIYREKV